MSGPLRSKNGCWTCRLRKKKCDEGRPHCAICTSLEITCYGYDQQPEWMDGSEKERAMAKSLKEIVKHTSRRKITSNISKTSQIRIAPKDSDVSVTNNSLPSSQDGITPRLDQRSSQGEGASAMIDESAASLVPETSSDGSAIFVSINDSILLMHFLDNVFPLQYPMYKPDIQSGGRSWVLSHLLRSKPFYHAALATSAYHRRMMTLENTNHSFQVAALVEQEQHFESCIKLANQSAQTCCPNSGLGMLIAVLQLMFFELFNSNTSAWQVHLRAMMTIYPRGLEQNFAGLGLTEESRITFMANSPLSENLPIVTQEVMNLRFLSGTLIWLDIAFSVTSGISPSMLQYHPSLLASTSQTQLHEIMGCTNGLMLQIGRIATLHERKRVALHQGTFSFSDFGKIGAEITKEIHLCIRQATLEHFDISGDGPMLMTRANSFSPYIIITPTFAYMAFIYLHLLFHGFQNLEDLETSISEAMKNLRMKVPLHLLSSLVLPLFIIGSVARLEDEEFFRGIFSSAPLIDPVLKHRRSILPVLEEIWARRKSGMDFTWENCLVLTKDMLLI